MLSFIIENYTKDNEALTATLNSIERLKFDGFVINTTVIAKNDNNDLIDAIKKCPDDYFCIITAGDLINSCNPQFLATLINNKEHKVIRLNHHLATLDEAEESTTNGKAFNLNSQPKYTPVWVYYHIFDKNIFNSCYKSDHQSLLYSLYVYLYENYKIFFNQGTTIESQIAFPAQVGAPGVFDKEWYLTFLTDLVAKVSQDIDNKYVPLYIKSAVMYLFWARVFQNMNNSDKHIIDSEYPVFEKALYDYIQKIDDFILMGHGVYAPPKHFYVSLFQLKYGDNYKLTYTDGVGKKDIWIYFCGQLLQRVSELVCSFDLIDYDKKSKVLTLEYFVDNYIDLSNFELKVELDGQELPTEETYRFKYVKYFGKCVQKYATFRTVVDFNKFDINKKGSRIVFYLCKNGIKVPVLVNAKTYCARLNSMIKHSYWYFDKKVLMFIPERKGLLLKKGFVTAFIKELKNLLRTFTDTKSSSIIRLRLLYWLTYPYFRFKTIWLTYDKLYKGGDCGEYFYKYACTRARKTHITPAYVLNGDSDDFTRMKKEGYKPLEYQSLKHLLYYLNSDVVFATHGGVYNFNGFESKDIKYFQHLLHHDVCCIQHGLTVQQLAHNQNRIFNNMKRYYCASKYEVENLSRPIYGYEDKSALKLTGIPRYDGLVNNDKHQILITPTWRNYIAMPAVAKNAAKPYFPFFKETDYFKIYNELLSDEKLIETAKKTGYEIIYLLHPVVSAQIDDYPQNEFVKIIPAFTVDYEKILTESSLMVTDYSGVQFDFAYMRKPIVYYHPPKLPPHYKEGGFFYDSMGFGEICTEHKDLVDILCGYMENECKLKPFYKDRADDFFAFSDLNSCQRIYDDMLEYQKSKK